MSTNRKLKRAAKSNLRRHYWTLLFICLFASFVCAEYGSSINAMHDSSTANTYSFVPSTDIGLVQIFSDYVRSQLNSATKETKKYVIETTSGKRVTVSADELLKSYTPDSSIVAFTKKHGIIPDVTNILSQGDFVGMLFKGFASIASSKSILVKVLIIIALLIALFLWIFSINMIRVIMRRVFLETRLYSKFPTSRLLSMPFNRRWIKSSLTMMLIYFLQILFDITIIGGIITRYSFFMVPYIVAENPDIPCKDAIKLSCNMMRGHKFECFKLEISFAGWWILNELTFGLSGLLFSNAFQQATYCEYYVKIRALAKKNNLELARYFTDEFLFRKPTDEELMECYSNVLSFLKEHPKAPKKNKGIKGFFTNTLGITLINNQECKDYYSFMNIKHDQKVYRDIIHKKAYPVRLNPQIQYDYKNNKKRFKMPGYYRMYSIPTIILSFFTFAFVGWAWEVCLHLIVDGTFINRGTMYGPYLPIYGSGTSLLIMLLFRFRKRPFYTFLGTLIICGTIEYYSGYILELTNNGKKWWDYTGYFLNVDGRICAEALLAFGIGGLFTIYFIAPLICHFFDKIKLSIVLPLCIILISIFSIDAVRSIKNPNSGAGITDYKTSQIECNNQRSKSC